jgi:hypothetical protein
MCHLVDKSSEESSLEGTNEDKDEVFGWEVGVGEDWSHLNKRLGRRRAREEKVARDVKWLEKLQSARRLSVAS